MHMCDGAHLIASKSVCARMLTQPYYDHAPIALLLCSTHKAWPLETQYVVVHGCLCKRFSYISAVVAKILLHL